MTCTATGVAVVSGIGAGAALDGVPSSGVQVRIGGLCGCCIAFVGIGQINGNATVKPCKGLYAAVLQFGKIKALHRVRCKAKEKPGHF